jgi:hypothetical protein
MKASMTAGLGCYCPYALHTSRTAAGNDCSDVTDAAPPGKDEATSGKVLSRCGRNRTSGTRKRSGPTCNNVAAGTCHVLLWLTVLSIGSL